MHGHPLSGYNRLAEPVHQGFFQLCEVGGMHTSKGGLREIWLKVRQQSLSGPGIDVKLKERKKERKKVKLLKNPT
jgi:hypothetical protein